SDKSTTVPAYSPAIYSREGSVASPPSHAHTEVTATTASSRVSVRIYALLAENEGTSNSQRAVTNAIPVGGWAPPGRPLSYPVGIVRAVDDTFTDKHLVSPGSRKGSDVRKQ